MRGWLDRGIVKESNNDGVIDPTTRTTVSETPVRNNFQT